MPSDHVQTLSDHVTHHGVVDGVALAGEAALLGDQPAPVCGQGTQPAADRVGRIRRKPMMGCGKIVGDHGGVDGVGLGELPDRAGKAAHPGRRQDIDRQTGCVQAVRQPALIAA